MQSIVEWMTEILTLEPSAARGDAVQLLGMKPPVTKRIPAPDARDTQDHMKAGEDLYRDSTSSTATYHDMASRLRGRLTPGMVVTWESPLFGLLHGEVLTIDDQGDVDVYHPLLERIARIPPGWIRS